MSNHYIMPDGSQLWESWNTYESWIFFKKSIDKYLSRAGRKEGESHQEAVEKAKGCIEILEKLAKEYDAEAAPSEPCELELLDELNGYGPTLKDLYGGDETE